MFAELVIQGEGGQLLLLHRHVIWEMQDYTLLVSYS